jgi:hypothetical protein
MFSFQPAGIVSFVSLAGALAVDVPFLKSWNTANAFDGFWRRRITAILLTTNELQKNLIGEKLVKGIGA